MSARENLLYQWNVIKPTTMKLLEDISEEDSLHRGSDNDQNHIRWLTGHLLYCNSYAVSVLTEPKEDWTALKTLFGAGSEIDEDSSVYPSFADLRDHLQSTHDQLIGAIEAADDHTLAKPIGKEGEEKPLWNTLSFFALHEFYHDGQIVQIRRSLGREKPFG